MPQNNQPGFCLRHQVSLYDTNPNFMHYVFAGNPTKWPDDFASSLFFPKKQGSHFEVREKQVFNFLIELPGSAWARQVLQKTNLSVKARVLATNTEIVLVKEFLLPRDEHLRNFQVWKAAKHRKMIMTVWKSLHAWWVHPGILCTYIHNIRICNYIRTTGLMTNTIF